MFLRSEVIAEKILVGDRLIMSFNLDATPRLWQTFMPRRGDIMHRKNTDLVCAQLYTHNIGTDYNPEIDFEKWAAAEVTEAVELPAGMNVLIIPLGLYAVFLHQGAAASARETFQFIFQQWLPSSGFRVDQRPHFEILGPKYKNNDINSEEEIYIPICRVEITFPTAH